MRGHVAARRATQVVSTGGRRISPTSCRGKGGEPNGRRKSGHSSRPDNDEGATANESGIFFSFLNFYFYFMI